MSAAVMPLPEPPADDIDQVLEQLRLARVELAEAGRLVDLLSVVDGPLHGHALRRQLLELIVAERRHELWAGAIATLEARARTMGLQP